MATNEVYVTYKGLSGVDIPEGAVVFNNDSSLNKAQEAAKEYLKSLREDGELKDAAFYSATNTDRWFSVSDDFSSGKKEYYFLGSDDPESDLVFNITSSDALEDPSSGGSIIWVGFGKGSYKDSFDSNGKRSQSTVGVPTAGKVTLNIAEGVEKKVFRIAVAGTGTTSCDHGGSYESGGGVVNIHGNITVTNNYRNYAGGVVNVCGGTFTTDIAQTGTGLIRVTDNGAFISSSTSSRSFGALEIVSGSAEFNGTTTVNGKFSVSNGTVSINNNVSITFTKETVVSDGTISGYNIYFNANTANGGTTISGGELIAQNKIDFKNAKAEVTGGTITAGNSLTFNNGAAISNKAVLKSTSQVSFSKVKALFPAKLKSDCFPSQMIQEQNAPLLLVSMVL